MTKIASVFDTTWRFREYRSS